MQKRDPVARWIEQQWIQHDARTGQRSTMEEFAEFLGLSTGYVSQLLSGKRKPSKATAYKLADKTGDAEILNLLGLARKDPDLDRLQAAYDATPDDRKDELLNLVEEFLKAHGFERRKK